MILNVQCADILGLCIVPNEKERHRDRINVNAEHFKRVLSVLGSVFVFFRHLYTNPAKRRPNKNIGTVLSNGEL